MNALDTIENICQHQTLLDSDLRYCLVDSVKHPIQPNGQPARPNKVEDFVKLIDLLQCKDITTYAGVGISIQASKICAIDVDHCFMRPFDTTSADNRAKEILEMFKDVAYIEFSFSGTGLRVLFKETIIKDYAKQYYIKNDKQSIEYYQPDNSFRYVTITGKTIIDNKIIQSYNLQAILFKFLQKYMKRPIVVNAIEIVTIDNRELSELMKHVKVLYFTNETFQNLWFDTIHAKDSNGSSLESHRDYQLLALLFEKITQDKEKLRLVFEQSPYFKSKDFKHMQKWTKADYRYYNYQFNSLINLHSK